MRLDHVLVEREFFTTRSKAKEAILAGWVSVDGVPVTKASYQVSEESLLEVEKKWNWVSRSGEKLYGALQHWGISVENLHCLDIGSSTGGFTQVLLAGGGASVISVDVGKDQMDPSVAADVRVCLFEGCDARTLTNVEVSSPIDLLVADVSFVSLMKVLDVPVGFLKEQGQAVFLWKPQFEIGPKWITKRGIVHTHAPILEAQREFTEYLSSLGFSKIDWVASSVPGQEGNQEYLVWAQGFHKS